MDDNRKHPSMIVLKVRGIDCTTCALGIEKRVKKLAGVERVRTAALLNTIYVDYDESRTNVSEIMKAVDKAGYSNHLVRTEGR